MADVWDPVVYERFKAERAQPFRDLVAMVETPVGRMVDLGCGTGELTRWAVEALGARDAVGIDSSPSMLRDAATVAVPGRLTFEHGDIAGWTGDGTFDLVLSNAALHWVPDHAATLERWTSALAPGGQLAVQVPSNADYATHQVAADVADEAPFRAAFGAAGPPVDPVAANVLTPVQYAQVLFDLGYEAQEVRLRVYAHVLPETRAVVDWVAGTTLTRFKAVLDTELYTRFLARYEDVLVSRLGRHRPFLLPFQRVLFWARRTR